MKTDIKEIIGDRIRERRLKKGWTAREAAAAATIAAPESISTGRWQNWECAQRSPGVELYPYLAKVLDTTPQYLAGWTDEAGIGVETNKYIVANVNQGGVADELAFNVEALKRHGLHEHNLRLLTAPDDAMTPDIERGDLILIDKTATTITGAGIYALETGAGDMFVRYVRRDIGSGYSVYANDEKHAPTQKFTDDEFAELTVIGKFVFKGSWHNDQ
ncbi:TPA: LexA family transcriptional regulator [Vibrio parahaemolyticus]|uniref:XRE family transcriptional regulator n=1 Tax=Vibrio parahaemolyticus TaxID=670 RepID=UPI00387B1B47|nr:LexA family transcriptional regulator [Vibrio parahaemolyticus]HCE2923566.1 LexA family transcriptional regulator [Vibrio parahaemolyticus]HCG9453600.1 LexA family transcriptional regulator [Vibrio parahaemolyticus]HCH1769757.1 LexA family transcriptional regulator [Vibrio parahaemolyticus]HCH5178762.1 LexA family transcriptional regulator [Vibrio parahaemolyticus]